MSIEKGPKIDPKLKKEINEEGWEGGKEGGAAVFVGTKEETEKAREIMETEGVTENLESYIRLHKEIALSKEELEKYLQARHYTDIVSHPGCSELIKNTLLFIDKEGSVARVNIDLEKIKNIRVKGFLERDLKELGFKFEQPFKFSQGNQNEWQLIGGAIMEHQRKIEQEAEKEKKKEFDF